MSTLKKILVIVGRLPLLFIIDSVLKHTFLDFSGLPLGPLSVSFQPRETLFNFSEDVVSTERLFDVLISVVWFLFLVTVVVTSVVLVCCPIEVLLDVYGCIIGLGCLILSHKCNRKLLLGMEDLAEDDVVLDSPKSFLLSLPIHHMPYISIFVNLLIQALIVIAFDRVCVASALKWNRRLSKFSRYPVDIILFLSFTSPILGRSLLIGDFVIWRIFLGLALFLPSFILTAHSIFVMVTVMKIVLPAVRYIKIHIREIGFDGVILRVMEKANLSWLLRVFFFSRLSYQLLTSKTISESSSIWRMDSSEFWYFLKLLVSEVLFDLCGTILSIMSMASMISIVSGFCLSIVYRIIGAHDEEESMQPAVSGFLFVLLAMQTGITSISSETRLQLLLQNCILLLVANQHFVQGVTADLILKASTDDVSFKKHVRPMLPYLVFFSFPFIVVTRLWQYPFRLSWLLAISAFTIELVVKSLTTQVIYCINMVHSHTNYFHDNIDDLLFYVKAGSGCLDFVCGIFLFVNGAYIFFFESGGLIRLTMMIIHFYWNIYQTALRGLKTFQLRMSAWDKVNKLQLASQEQLDENADICSICYQEMTEAVVIKCSHVFHRACLKKWLTIQERCPLCHTDLGEGPSASANNNDNEVEDR
ncbi:E3 ubiquitin-protein ligase RNF139 [Aplysia californica]|uniref:E3 ubiquitin-protein ligase RNF139 n=1 Tax=Aplysia californica TaxID=6500 RepID=A0ABM0JWN8_APLCA|nr:E3 ubiquitin-protein ligase RNF139 [Aplysia californica]